MRTMSRVGRHFVVESEAMAAASPPPSSKKSWVAKAETLAAMPIYVVIYGHFNKASQNQLSNAFRTLADLNDYGVHVSDVEVVEEPPTRYVLHVVLGVPGRDYPDPTPAQKRLDERLSEIAENHNFTITSPIRFSTTKPGVSTRTTGTPPSARTKARIARNKAVHTLASLRAREEEHREKTRLAEETKAAKSTAKAVAKKDAQRKKLEDELAALQAKIADLKKG